MGLLLATWNRRLKFTTFSLFSTPLRATKLPDAVVDDGGWVALCVFGVTNIWDIMGPLMIHDDTIYWE